MEEDKQDAPDEADRFAQLLKKNRNKTEKHIRYLARQVSPRTEKGPIE